jgi:histidinol-phosphate aminotransferase
VTNTRRFLTGLVGAGIAASLSPPLHEREAELNGLRLVYQLIDLDTLGVPVADTPALLAAARQLGFAGVNVTHPCKQVVLEHLDELSSEAAAIGAVNTVTFAGGRSVGHNTDWLGFTGSVERRLPDSPRRRLVLLGAGGAGAAVAYAMLTTGTERLTVVDLDRDRTDALVERMARRFGSERIAGAEPDDLEAYLADADGLIQATPVGMAANPGVPLPVRLLTPDQWVADLVYTPLETQLLREARALGCRTLPGGTMLVFQAVEAFRLFTGVRPDANRMLSHFGTLTSRPANPEGNEPRPAGTGRAQRPPVAVRPRLRPELDELHAFKAAPVAATADGTSYLLAANESPDGPLPSVVGAVTAATARINRYPDGSVTELTDDIARWLGRDADRVVVGAGSVALIQMLFEAVGEPGAEIVYAWRSFEAYPVLAKLAGVRAVPVPLREERHDLDAMAAAITPQTRLVIVCNPNNPTGTVVRHSEVEDFLARVPAHCLVVFDEAYREYVRDETVPDALPLVDRWPNVVVLRTFSKAFGLAGLRVGYLVAQPDVAGQVRKTRLPYSVSHLAQAAASASLRAEDELVARVESTVKERDRVRAALLDAGWQVPPSEANLLWLRLNGQSVDFATECAAHGVNVRAFPGEGVRVSIGEPSANDAFLAVALTYPHRG